MTLLAIQYCLVFSDKVEIICNFICRYILRTKIITTLRFKECLANSEMTNELIVIVEVGDDDRDRSTWKWFSPFSPM